MAAYKGRYLEELQRYCQARGLPADGHKRELAARLETRDAVLQKGKYLTASADELRCICEWRGVPMNGIRASLAARLLDVDAGKIACEQPIYYEHKQADEPGSEEPTLFGQYPPEPTADAIALSLHSHSAESGVLAAWCSSPQGPIPARNEYLQQLMRSPHLAGEVLIYASDNVHIGDKTRSFLAMTTAHFYRVHENKLYTKVPLAGVASVGIKKMGLFQDDKILFNLKGGSHDTAGCAFGAALAEWLRILGIVVG